MNSQIPGRQMLTAVNHILSIDKYKVFRKSYFDLYRALDNFYNQMPEILLIRVKKETIDMIKNPRLAMINIFTAAKNMVELQNAYQDLFDKYR